MRVRGLASLSNASAFNVLHHAQQQQQATLRRAGNRLWMQQPPVTQT